MKVKMLFLAVFLVIAAKASADPDPNFHIYLCFGQSNMESGGRMEEMDKTVDKRFQVLADFDAPNRGWKKGNWYDAVPPLTARGTGLSLVDYFGRTMVANLPEKIRVGVIKVSVPGTKIELWDKDSFRTYLTNLLPADSWKITSANRYDGNPCQYLVDLAKIAQKDGVIKGIVIHQGESNFQDPEWPAKVKKIKADLVKDLNLKAQDLTLLAGEVVNADHQGEKAAFNEILNKLPETIPNAYAISSAGLPCNPDHLHFTAAGLREFGKRYAEKMLSVQGYKMDESK
jgi:para-nitrobenzyl esterase